MSANSAKPFDGTIGNPPWDVIEPKSQEFFTDFDPLASVKKEVDSFTADPLDGCAFGL